MCLLVCMPVQAAGCRTIRVEIPVFCRDVQTSSRGVYDIVIEPEDELAPAPESGQLRVKNGETEEFYIPADEPGTYLYRIYQQPGDEQNVQYDTSVYAVSVFVVNDDQGGLNCSVSARVNGRKEKPDQVEFCNTLLSDDQSCGEMPVSAPVTPEYSLTVQRTDKDVGIVRTGGQVPVALMTAMMIGSAGVILLLSLYSRKGQRKEEEKQHDKP